MPEFETVLYETKGKLAFITLNRPDKLNAFNRQLLDDLGDALRTAGADEKVRVVILRGAGRAFSVGYDVSPDNPERQKHLTVEGDLVKLRRNMERWLEFWDFPKPVIAQVHGYCLAGAGILVHCCDLAVVAEDATIGWPSVPLGGGLIGPTFAFQIGAKQAKRMSFIAGSKMTGAQAAAMGLANEAVPAEQLEAATLQLAREVAKMPQDLLRLKKMAVNRVWENMGFKTAVLAGAEWDTMAHFMDGTQNMLAEIRTHGLKEAIRRFHAQDE